ncbi:hypothetical protein KS4_35370 [Poriferisphaera corsica]|uniref:Uncharacterized protein n=1 Tax=Poriferisphaera corsica TaxID=2528020 RepID=A0A517YZ01_9BACT|nr:hypothetical protein KS4_35370 [Poriferisphaera corsica]
MSNGVSGLGCYGRLLNQKEVVEMAKKLIDFLISCGQLFLCVSKIVNHFCP